MIRTKHALSSTIVAAALVAGGWVAAGQASEQAPPAGAAAAAAPTTTNTPARTKAAARPRVRRHGYDVASVADRGYDCAVGCRIYLILGVGF